MYCEVVPAYGPENLPAELGKAEDILEPEEYSVMLLVAELSATLLTIDGRLAQLAVAAFGGKTVWPQILLSHAGRKGLISRTDYSMAVIRSFISNRNFVSLSPNDLVLMCMQGGYFLQLGLQRFKDCLSSALTEFKSTIAVAFEFLKLQAAHHTQLKGFLELFGHIVEAALRHPACDVKAFIDQAAEFAHEIALTNAGPDSPFPPLSAMRSTRYEILSNAMQEVIVFAGGLAKQPVRPRVIKLRALMCMDPPWLGFDGDVRDPDVTMMESDSSSKDAETKTTNGESISHGN
jgi:hypothetical protein